MELEGGISSSTSCSFKVIECVSFSMIYFVFFLYSVVFTFLCFTNGLCFGVILLCNSHFPSIIFKLNFLRG